MTKIADAYTPEWDTTVEPISALLLYQVQHRVIGTLHPLKASRQEQAVIGAGRPFAQRDVQALLEWLAGLKPSASIEWLPPELLAQGEDFRVWWTPATVRSMWFLIQDKRLGFRVPWPSLVWIAHKTTLWCAALTQKARPKPDTVLYHAPLMNIDDQGQVCIGTADIPPDHRLKSQAAWEAVLFESNFSHVNHHQTLKQENSVSTEQPLGFWQSLDGKKRFPSSMLNPMDISLQWKFQRRNTDFNININEISQL